MSDTMTRAMTADEWRGEAVTRFGADHMAWSFVCPACGHVQTVADYRDAGAPSSAAGFSCVGRYIEGSREAFGGEGDGPCNYTGGGLFRLNPVTVTDDEGREIQMFAFAEPSGAEEVGSC